MRMKKHVKKAALHGLRGRKVGKSQRDNERWEWKTVLHGLRGTKVEDLKGTMKEENEWEYIWRQKKKVWWVSINVSA